MRCRVGDGQNTSFWYDNLTSLGPLIRLLGAEGPRALCVPITSKVAEACNDQGWELSSPRSEDALLLHAHLTSIPSQAYPQ